MIKYVLYTFHTTSKAMESEILLEKKNIKSRLVPLLPEIDAGCGLALRFSIDYKDEVENLFEKMNLKFQDRFILIYEENKRKPKVIDYDISR